MSQPRGTRIRVLLRWIEILDTLDPAWKEKGEFRFRARVSSRNRGVDERSRFPEQGHYDISDHPAWNKVLINRTLFEGEVDDHLVIELEGEELDLLTPNDHLQRYRRELTGDPASWAGWYGAGEGPNPLIDPHAPENMKDWRVCYRIDVVGIT